MDLRFTYHDSETGEEDTIDLTIAAKEFDSTVAPEILTAFQKAMAHLTGEEEVDVKLESFVVAGDRGALTFREKVVTTRGHSYDVLITGLIYSIFIK